MSLPLLNLSDGKRRLSIFPAIKDGGIQKSITKRIKK
jgi:hypothetical protein